MTHPTTTGFSHQRLDVFHASMELVLGVERLAAALPRGHADTKDQVRRAASATLRNITEGANRWSPRDKAARYVIARGECGECDCALEMIQHLGLAPAAEVRALRRVADRIGAMLTGLIKRHRRAASPG
jgi:four helix bundle protein